MELQGIFTQTGSYKPSGLWSAECIMASGVAGTKMDRHHSSSIGLTDSATEDSLAGMTMAHPKKMRHGFTGSCTVSQSSGSRMEGSPPLDASAMASGMAKSGRRKKMERPS